MPQYSDGSAVAGRERIRRRTTSSCDACKARKTKCIDPVPGPCRYCAGISAACTITPKPKRRPFYSVSEEEYRYGIEILQRLFPNETLNLRTLRNLAMKVAEEHENPGRDGTPPSRGMPNQATAETEPEDDAPLQDNAESESFSSAPSVSAGPLVEAAPTISQQEWDEPRVPILAQKEGYLTTDWSGTTRYIGPHCDALFISAVNSCAEGEPLLPFFRQPTHALRFTVAPPASLESRSSVTRPCPVNFPPRQDWARHLDRYFKDVNSTYWLISAESFYSRLDSTYATRSTEDSEAPWTCFLCAVLALTSQTKDVNGDSTRQCGLSSGSPQSVEDNSTTAEYISSAKLLLKDVMDEANLDSIRAFCAMSIFMYNEGFPIPSYLYIGTAVKIAYTLGLHQPKAYASMTASNRETALRMAWTMYQVDCEVSRPTGRPTSIDQANWHPIMPSETLTTTGIFDPWELFESTISFHMEDLRLFSRFSGLANHANQEAVYGEINDCVVSLQMWYDRIPSHLQWNIPVPTSHRRPICLLHLRYWSTILSCTRVVFLRDIQLVGMTQGHRPPQTDEVVRGALKSNYRRHKIHCRHRDDIFLTFNMLAAAKTAAASRPMYGDFAIYGEHRMVQIRYGRS
ncbi:hypothetical protein GQ53DRAFT_82957 [Thozetella sp. PMI_491]|nr:hypothetical protein GQ53DRAFT_82957 [Thozetella sp. PMI_491]